MKLNVKYMIAAFALLGLVGCDKNFEEFETSGGGSPAAVELSTVVSEETILFICRPLMRLMKQEQFRN